MKWIAHRGNLYGPNSKTENHPDQITKCISLGFDVEIDVWYVGQQLFLGHDEPQYCIDINFLLQNKDKLWCHCKHFESLEYLHIKYPELHIFTHDQDEYTLTSNKWIWCYPGKNAPENSIVVMPERFPQKKYHQKNIGGICSDFIGDNEKINTYFI